MPPSTAHPEALPDIPALRRLTQSLAMLDAILSPEWQYRYYSFNSRWSEGEQMASMRDGCGDDWFLLFDSVCGAAIKGCAHECSLAENGNFASDIQTAVPAEFGRFLKESAFSMDHATFCLWRRHADTAWHVVLPTRQNPSWSEDGSTELLGILDGDPATYQTWAEGYYEQTVSLESVRTIYAHHPLNATLVTSLNPEAAWSGVSADAAEIGYPLAGV